MFPRALPALTFRSKNVQNGPYPMQLVVLMAVMIDEMMLARICNTVFQVSFFMFLSFKW